MAAVGVVPTHGRGSLPFALYDGEPLVAVASWALQDAGVELLDFTATWAEVQETGAALVVHDPLCPALPASFLRDLVERADETVLVGTRPVTDTVKTSEGGVLGHTVDRSTLLVVASPVLIPPPVVAALEQWPDLTDLAALVTSLREQHTVELVEAPPAARRLVDESDLALLEADGETPDTPT